MVSKSLKGCDLWDIRFTSMDIIKGLHYVEIRNHMEERLIALMFSSSEEVSI